MGRPQEVDVDALLAHARAIWVKGGMSAVTIRALSERSGVSNGAIYYHFASRDDLLAQVWAAEATAFRAFRADQIEAARRSGNREDAAVAASLATGGYADVDGAAARVLVASRPDAVSSDGVPSQLVKELSRHRALTDGLVGDLAAEVWDRSDEVAQKLMRNCVVDIPARIFMSAGNDPLARYAIEQAVRGVLAAGPPN
ncbi:AcrR family transcriptional regulator [Aeromicrobium panaciterrae]|uniref:AcrR family transcriptional regulator n=1 Tax=Aeromicrobium panaciterrae TaxID=363861 RepID=A0ABU1UMA0_9ACTN|nr:helix-turn-helix domain-containing protein [Aeromicrobium panaciterrae]MDR7086313.1 AcrR family transcriptional regulator [Aeromicrobium panaciterrae]